MVQLLVVIVFAIPLNLGKHFIIPSSYVNGLLVDYLIPTLYVQDILVFCFSLVFIFEATKSKNRANYKSSFSKINKSWLIPLATIFIFSFGLSSIGSVNITASLVAFLRFSLYTFFCFSAVIVLLESDKSENLPLSTGGNLEDIELGAQTFYSNYPVFLKVAFFSLFLFLVLGTVQLVLQRSVFNNYLVLGEQPYTSATFGISVETFFGNKYVPPYSTFRHPNVFAGYVGLLVFFLFTNLKDLRNLVSRKLLVLCFTMCVIVLVSASSFNAFLAILIGFLLYYGFSSSANNKNRQAGVTLAIFILSIVISFSFLINTVPDFTSVYSPSVVVRAALASKSKHIIIDNSLFGTGLATSPQLLESYYFERERRFPQPVHNIFLLLGSETGLIGLVLFLSFFLYTLRFFYINKNYGSLCFVLLYFLLGLFDHFIFTSHQILLLFWTFLSLSLYRSEKSLARHQE